MAIDVTIRSHTVLLQGGYNAVGVAGTTKSVVVGDIDIITYTASGEPLIPKDLGLTTIDGLYLSVVDIDSALPTATILHNVGYDHTGELILLYDGAAGVTDADTDAQVRFVAFGDSARAPILA